jgi:BioD-like phosphotransacetylase family protein
LQVIAHIRNDRELLFIEGGRDFSYGISVHLDVLSLVKYTGGKLFIVVGGEEDSILDDLIFMKRHVDLTGINLGGVIVNKVQKPEEFQKFRLPVIRDLGLRVLGVIPYQSELSCFPVYYLADHLFARIITGEGGLKKSIKNIVIGAWSANVFLQNPVFKKEKKLVITGGDRTDMILAALESDTSAIILTNNILPPSNIIYKAGERNIPLLMVSTDTYQTVKQIESLEPLLTKDDSEKVELLKQLFTKNVKMDEVLSS